MSKKAVVGHSRIYGGLVLLVFGFLSPLLSFFVQDLDWHSGIKTLIIGGLVFGIPEVFMVIGIAVMGRETWEVLSARLHGFLSAISPQKVSRARYYAGLTLFCICLLEGAIEIHATFIREALGENISFFHWVMNILFLMSFIIAGGEFWDKIRGIFIYD